MADNKLFDFMNTEIPAPKRSNVPWREVNRFSASCGYIYPSLVVEVLPTDRITGNLHSILRSRPTISSVYGSFRESHQAFFVPARLYSKVLDQLMTFGDSRGDLQFNPNVDVDFPKIGWFGRPTDGLTRGPADGVFLPSSLPCMLNMFPSMFRTNNGWNFDEEQNVFEGMNLNAIPLVAYYDILRNYYYNSQELDMPFAYAEMNRLILPDDVVHYINVPKDSLDKFISDVYDGIYSTDNWDAPDIFSDLSDYGIKIVSQDYLETLENHSLASYLSDFTARGDNHDVTAMHGGLGVRCFDDDYFTTALNNEYVDELNNTARVVVSNNSFSVSQLQRANRLHKHISRNVLAGNDYEDYLYVHFNAKLGREVNKPVFLGSTTNSFNFEDIYSTQVSGSYSDSDKVFNTHLGTRAGTLNSKSSSNDGFIDFTANEYGYLIVLSSIIPQVSYSRGIPKMYLKTSTSDLYSPEFDAWSFQDVNPLEVDATLGVMSDINHPVTKSQPAWFEHLATYDKHHGLYATDLEYGFQILNRDGSYESLNSTYIRPWEWNYIFQYQGAWFDNFEWQIMLDLNLYRPISKQILPSMI